MTTPAPRCRACGSKEVALRGRKNGEFIAREFEFHQCAACGFMAVEPFSGFEIYDDAYYRGGGPDPYVDYETEYRDWRRTDRGLEFDDMTRIAEAHVATGASFSSQQQITADSQHVRWLDFGCGSGAFLKYLRERRQLGGRALDLTGHDVGSYANLLREQDGFRILGLDELPQEPANRYDIVSMIEVIEHLPEPLTQLELAARLLKPGGLLLLTTGNLDSRVARRRGIQYRYCAPEIHVSLFTPRALAALYRKVGLEPRRVRYRGAVKFKVVKTLRHHPLARAVAGLALRFPPAVSAVDFFYGVSAMPCAVKPGPQT